MPLSPPASSAFFNYDLSHTVSASSGTSTRDTGALTELGLPDEFLEHASRGQIIQRVGLDAQSIARDIVAQVVGARIPHAKQIDAPIAPNLNTKPLS